jgi:ADP-heptose:LPS heptosyltransferase
MSVPFVVMLRPLGLGDFLTGVPAYRAIARAFPGHRIVLAAPRVFEPILDLVGGIDELHPTQPLQPLDAALHGADVAIDLHGRGSESQRILLAARPRRLIAFAHDDVAQTTGGATWISAEHEVARWCRMLTHAGIPADPRDLDLRASAGPFTPRRAQRTIIHPSAASEARRWPIARWAAIARAESVAGRIVTITGGPADVRRARQIAERAGLPRSQVVAGRTNLRELAALVAAAGRVVCGDTGVAHLATALRTPSVVLFGPMSPALWGPPPERAYHRVLWAGRSGDPHGSRVDRGLLAITVADVLDALHELDLAARIVPVTARLDRRSISPLRSAMR